MREAQARGEIRPEVEHAGDSVVCVTIFVPEAPDVAEAAALAMAARMGLERTAVLSRRVLHPAEGSVFEVKGTLPFAVTRGELRLPERPELLDPRAIESFVRARSLVVVGGTVGQDEHSVGLREILDIKHGGLERFGFRCHDLGTSVPVGKLLDAAVETRACAVLVSTILSHGDVHRREMRRLVDLAAERGLRKRLVLIAGGTQVSDELARSAGMDAGFGRGTRGHEVASFLVRALQTREAQA